MVQHCTHYYKWKEKITGAQSLVPASLFNVGYVFHTVWLFRLCDAGALLCGCQGDLSVFLMSLTQVNMVMYDVVNTGE